MKHGHSPAQCHNAPLHWNPQGKVRSAAGVAAAGGFPSKRVTVRRAHIPPMAAGLKSRTGPTRVCEGHPRFFVREIHER